jgi:asparagine synthase (glutamine-hydrolysing)
MTEKASMGAVYCRDPSRMSGIAGFWNLGGQPASRDVLAAMSETLRHRGGDADGVRTDGSAGFVCRQRWVTVEEHGERQPLAAGRSGAMLVFDGRLDNRQELLDALGAPPHCSDAALALAAYDAWTTGFAERLNGDFAAAIFDPVHQHLILARDAIGVRPIYYTHTPHLVAFASEIKALLAHPAIAARPDVEGVADLMLVGSRPLDRQDLTCFDGVRSVVPAHVVLVTARGLTRRRYWDFHTNTPLRFGSYEDYVEGFRERFTEAVRRRLRSAYPVAMSVSGGLDSSSIFCAAETIRRRRPRAAPAIAGISYVSDRRETDEQRFLRDIEAQYGVTFDRFEIEPRTGLVHGAATQIAAMEAPFVDYMWGVTKELYARAGAAGARTLLSGHWGDQVLFSSAYLVDLLRRGAWRSIWRHTREYARYFGEEETQRRRRRLVVDAARHAVPPAIASPLKWLRLRFFERRPQKEWFSPAFLGAALKDQYRLATFDRPFHSAHARAVYLEARSKYHVQCMEWNNKAAALHGLDAAFPFLDRDLIAYLMAIPGEMHAHGGVPRALLREAVRGVLPETIRARTWKADFTAFVNSGLNHDAATIVRTLHDECLGVQFGYLDRARLQPALARLRQALTGPDCVASWDLADTYSLEMWLQVFLVGRRGASPQPQACEENTSHAKAGDAQARRSADA